MKSNYPDANVLIVDDETSILQALRRLFRRSGWEIKLAESGQEALSIIKDWAPDLVVSDMRMPGMSGAELLTEITKQYPETIRLLLTGYADLESTIAAINDAHIFSYIAKPWDNELLFRTMENGLKMRFLEKEKIELQEMVNQQNALLRDLNKNLKTKVDRQAQEIDQASMFVDQAMDDIQKNFDHVIDLLSMTQEFLETRLAGHGRRVSVLSKKIAAQLKLSERQKKNVEIAGMLHDIGNIGLNRAILHKNYNEMTEDDQLIWRQHAAIGATLLSKIPALTTVAEIVHHHHEHYNGSGFPKGLKGEQIPLEARIIGVADYFDEFATGIVGGKIPEKADVIKQVRKLSGTHFDPNIVDALLALLKSNDMSFMRNIEKTNVMSIPSSNLLPGMTLADDLSSPEGVLLFKKGNKIDDSTIRRIISLEREHGCNINARISLQPLAVE